MHTNHPHYLNTQATVLLWRSDTVEEATKRQEADFRDALDLYTRSASLRPLWPNTWAAMAMIKWRLDEFDADMLGYINNADKLGPYIPSVHVDLVRLGFALLQRDPFTQHVFFKRHLLRGLNSGKSRATIVEQIKQHNAGIITCRWLVQEKQPPPYGLCSK